MILKRTRLVRSALLAAGFLVGNRAAFAQVKASNVFPGKSMGRIVLGMTPTQVQKLVGKPGRTRSRRGGLRVDTYLSKKTRETTIGTVRDHLDVLYRRGRVVQIEATSPVFKVLGSISTLTSARVVRYSPFAWQLLTFDYFEPQHETSWVNYYFCDVAQGFSIEFEGEEAQLSVDQPPTTLIVHKKGSRVIPDEGGTRTRSPLTLDTILTH